MFERPEVIDMEARTESVIETPFSSTFQTGLNWVTRSTLQALQLQEFRDRRNH